MKQLKFETIKGYFILLDIENIDFFVSKILRGFLEENKINRLVGGVNFFSVREVTEEQASEIVGIEINVNHSANHNIMRLEELIKSKGCHLFENPYKYTKTESEEIADKTPMCRFVTKEEKKAYIEEQKTFYNPYIFKLK